MPDPIFADPRLAGIYDALDSDRRDLDVYAALAEELGAGSVLDVGCGTGTFACLLANRGLEVVAVDPAEASLEVARGKPGADRVRWILGDATNLPPRRVDLVTMTGNVAQVLLSDHDMLATLRGIRDVLGADGRCVFEVRDPAREAWRRWTRQESYARVDIERVGVVESWVEVVDRRGQLVTFRWTFRFEMTHDTVISESTLRFRERDQIEALLHTAGLRVLDVRDAPDRPGDEFVFVAARAH